MTEEWVSLKKFDGEGNSYSLVGGIATTEPEDMEVKCPCPNCGKEFISDKIEVPAPNFDADIDRDSRQWTSEQYECPNPDCDFMFDIEINNGFGGMDIGIEGVARNDISFRHYPAPIDDETG